MAWRSALRRARTVLDDRSDEAVPHVQRLGDLAADALLAASFADERRTIELEVPVGYTVLQGGFSFTSSSNPFIIGLERGVEALASFYAAHAPKDLSEMYGLDHRGLRGEELPPWELPWLHRIESRRLPRGEHGLGPEHGLSFCGPATAEKVELEIRRLEDVRSSIKSSGYRPTRRSGPINGQLLVSGSEYRFFVRGGKHRTAALVSLGRTHIPVRFRPTWPRLIDRRDATSWSLVASGEMDPEVARSAFDAYFERPPGRRPSTTTTERTRL